jgi:23S rRNA pseudouridine1911/1915/1917 synthase
LKQSGQIISTDAVTADPEEGFDAEIETETRVLKIETALHGARLDQVLVKLVPEFSRSYLQQLVESGAVRVNDKEIRKSAARVKAGDIGAIELRPTPQSQAFKPEQIELQVVFSDPHLLVIDKPAGLVVHPAPGNWSGTLLNALLALDNKAAALPRAGIVHRLDKNTSGLMVIARTRASMDALVQLIAARDVQREYLALAHRPWSPPSRRDVDAPVGRDPRNRLRMAVVDLARSAGKSAKTTFRGLDSSESACLVHCILHTGRTHQIRVHMASIGHPLIADEVYGGQFAGGLVRQALHAFKLAFVHPITSQALRFESALPPDLESALVNLGLRYNGT